MSGEFRICRGLKEAGPDFGPCAITIGNFDGVHIGHREIFRHVVAVARRNGWKPSAMTFDPHPAKLLAPERVPRLLSTPEERCRWMREAGLTQAVIVPFTREFSGLTAEEFAREILVKCLGAAAVLVGGNFHFGHDKGGDSSLLSQLGAQLGFTTQIIPPLEYRKKIVSSSLIRGLIGSGEVALAGRMLGRCYALSGEVVAGRGVGSKATVPTLNLRTTADVLPGTGVYVTQTTDLERGQLWPSVTNVGFRPTFDGEDLTIETFLLRSPGDQAFRHIMVELLHRLREEKKFASPADLKAQILTDVRRAGTYFRRREKYTRKETFASDPS
jgi:riboflavin kinase/FMN adenylyltransferase